ncbi:PIN domain nuclease [Falsiroseomonas bella]|uniref:PIN domain nuclease n=2 Tax=Falsiroseomonas bella TaxID=2184016 RepID=A0A317F6C5_9PROT|nr:PIN domain nuclease [Falsiroseomonas bella]
MAQGEPMSAAARAAIRDALAGDGAFVSALTAWEVGLLSRARGKRPATVFLPDTKTWLDRVFAAPGIRPVPVTREIAHQGSALQGAFHNDPVDRIIVATALTLGVPVVTRDRAILAYAEAGFVQAVAC